MYDVLLLDDECTVRKLLYHVLAGAGWRVQQACRIREALGILNGEGARLLIADKRLLHGEDGHVFARAARQHWPALSVIFMSSDRTALSALELQDREWSLAKPLPMRDLVDLVAAAIPIGESAVLPAAAALMNAGRAARQGAAREHA